MWSLAGSHFVDQRIRCFRPGLRGCQSAALGLYLRQLVSAPGAHPPKVSGVGIPAGFPVWVLSQGFSFGRPVR